MVDYRLSDTITPLHYAIDVDTSPKRKTFSGSLTVEIRLNRATPIIEMHARDLRCSDVRIRVGKRTIKGKARLRKERETVEFVFPRAIDKGKGVLSVAFRGTLSPNMHGLYLAQDGAQKAVVSQCEASDARAIFPCLDEPLFKATLQWTVRTDPGLEVVTNGVLDKSSVRKNAKGVRRAVHVFKRSKKMSTYLAAIAVGDFDSTIPVRIAKTVCRFLTDRGKSGQAAFAEEVTRFVLPWYEQYFAHRYHFQKLDQVAVPGFDAGAMENSGAIFYRQNLLLMQEGVTSWRGQKTIAEVVAHELAHQWFGNLVTMCWWDDLWLNEAFATWIAYKCTDLWQPDWRMWDEFLDGKEGALRHDALVSTHPIYTEVRSPAEATELFDLITYEKGCAVLRMVESYLGEERFRAGIRLYIQRFKNGNARGNDLWAALSETSGELVATLMGSWIEQEGFPLVQMSVDPQRAKLSLRQCRFFADKTLHAVGGLSRWNIPILIRYGGKTPGSKIVRTMLTQESMQVDLPAGTTWAYANADAAGFYRTQLDDSSLKALIGSHDGAGLLVALNAAERITLLADQWALVSNGSATIDGFMECIDALRDDHDHVVVRAVAGHLLTLHRQVVADADRSQLALFVQQLFGPQLEELGWDAADGEGPEVAERRRLVVATLGDIGRDPAVLDEAERRIEVERRDPTAIEANLAGALIAVAALRGDKGRLQQYVGEFLQRKNSGAAPELQSRYLSAFCYFEADDVVRLVLQACLDGTVPQEQLRTVLVPMLARPAAQELTWKFLQKRWPQISSQVGAMGVSRLVEATGALPPHLADDVASFFRRNPVANAKRAVAQALEALQLKAELLSRESTRLGSWLAANLGAH